MKDSSDPMKIQARDLDARLTKTDLLVVFAFQGSKPSTPKGVTVPQTALRGFEGEFRSKRTTDGGKSPSERVLVIGLGAADDLGVERLRRAAALGAVAAERLAASSVTVWAGPGLQKAVGGPRAAGEALAEGALLGSYRYDGGKSKPKPRHLKTAVLCGSGRDFHAGALRGKALAAACACARDLGNAPGNRMRPRDMAAEARRLARRSERISCRVLNEAAMAKLGMGALLSVSAGSAEAAHLIHLTYKPKRRSQGRVALVGKGLTFDSGGISIKPSAKMSEMKFDMCGGAAVLGTFHALGEIDVPFEVHGIVPTSENMPDARATKPGDLVKAMNGTTIEVLNTDAEGRLILSDALCYAEKKVKPDMIVDLATLTGAVVVALGHEFSGLFATTNELRDDLVAAGEEVGEALWPLPLTDFQKDWMKGEVGDLKNIHNPDQGAGSTAGAAFLSHFVSHTEWAHIDIAGAAWGGRNRDWVGGSQASGVGPRLLMRWLENRA